MSDNLCRYKAIRDALKRLYPIEPKGNLARYLNILAALISGIVGSRRTNLPAIADKIPDGNKPDSRIKQFYRWLSNERIDAKLYFLPFAQVLLASLAHLTIVLVMDGSIVGRGCITLMVSVIYKKRALPIAWIVVKGKKGHLPEDLHVKLLEQVHDIVPGGTDIVFLGDGEFDGIKFLAILDSYGWAYVCRTAKNAVLYEEGEEFSFKELDLIPGRSPISLPNIRFTQQAMALSMLLSGGKKDIKTPFIS